MPTPDWFRGRSRVNEIVKATLERAGSARYEGAIEISPRVGSALSIPVIGMKAVKAVTRTMWPTFSRALAVRSFSSWT